MFRVLLDSVSFSRIICQPLASFGVPRADSSVSILRFTLFVNPFFELFSEKFVWRGRRKSAFDALPLLKAREMCYTVSSDNDDGI